MNSIVVMFLAMALTEVVVSTSGPRTFHVKGMISGPRNSIAAGVKVEFDDGKNHTAATTDAKGLYAVELPVGSYTMTVQAPKTGNLTFSIFQDYVRPLFLVTSARTVTLNGTLYYARPTCDFVVLGSKGQSQKEQEAAWKNACGGKDLFPVPSEKGVPFQIAVQYPRRELTNRGYLYKSDKIYETEPPVPVSVSYNLFSLEADEVTYDSGNHMLIARGDVTVEDGSTKRRADVIKLRFENGRATFNSIRLSTSRIQTVGRLL
jgi:hypothetical protein